MWAYDILSCLSTFERAIGPGQAGPFSGLLVSVKSSDYRLGEFRIKESLLGGLSWEAHFGFGEYREGRCFLRGRILILSEAKEEGIGFLKGKFIDSLADLPRWTRSDYYCQLSELISCATGRQATETAVRRWCEPAGDGQAAGVQSDYPAETAYRLGKYRIIEGKGGLIQYRTHAGRNRLVTGEALLVEGILFLGRTETAEVGGREEFLSGLKTLPKWDKTEFYSFASLLKKCDAPDSSLPRMDRIRGILKRTVPPGVARKAGQKSEKPKHMHPVYPIFNHLEGLLSNIARTIFITFKYSLVMTGRAIKSSLPLLEKYCRWTWKKLRRRPGKKLTGR